MESLDNELIKHRELIAQSEASGHSSAAVQFSTLLVAQLMLVNSGALFTFPAFLEKARLEEFFVRQYVGSISLCFVVGVVLATICGYLAYLNYGLLKFEAIRRSYSALIEMKYPTTPNLPEHILKWKNEQLEIYRIKSRRAVLGIKATVVLANISGIGSLVAFVWGCLIVRMVILQ